MGVMVDVELARSAGFEEAAAGECTIEMERDWVAGARESYAAVEPDERTRTWKADAFTVYELTVTLAGKPVIRCRRDFHDQVVSALWSREDAEPAWSEEDLLADAPAWIGDDALAEAVFNASLDEVVAARGGSMALAEVAALASDAWDEVELLA